jgi:hypothetical protein
MIELPDLDDRTFADLAAEARALIPTLAPGWTDHNPTDPGIVLVELFAWLTEIVLYRLDRIPERSYRTFLRLLRGPAPAGGEELLLDDAIRETLAELRERYRAITSDDFEHLALHRWQTLAGVEAMGIPGVVRRARCFTEQSPATLTQPNGREENHYTVAIVADSLTAARGDLAAFDPARRFALELDGASGYVDCGADASLALDGALTLAAWVFPRRLLHRQAIVSKQGDGRYELVLETSGALSFRHADGGGGGAVSEPRVPAGRWSHVAAVRDGNGAGVRFYVDGKLAGEAVLAPPAAPAAAPVWIGRSPAGGNFFDGYLRDVCIWGVARNDAELSGDLRRLPPGADDAPGAARPVACWRLDRSDDGDHVRDAETSTAATSRPRDGLLASAATPSVPAAARWRDVVRPLAATPPLLGGLRGFFDEWRLLTTKVHVIDYAPLAVTAAAKLYLRSDGVPETVHELAVATLERYFDPFRGWRGAGWPFGRPIYVSDVHALLDRLPGVDFVESVQIELAGPAAPGRPPAPRDDRNAISGIALHPHELPALGVVTLEIVTPVGAV